MITVIKKSELKFIIYSGVVDLEEKVGVDFSMLSLFSSWIIIKCNQKYLKSNSSKF